MVDTIRSYVTLNARRNRRRSKMATKEVLSQEVAPNVTVQDLITVFNDLMDGNDNFHNIMAMTGLGDEKVNKILEVYKATVDL